jgi:flagellar protein FlaF
MYQFSYAEVLDETPRGARERERHAISHSLWGAFLEDLASPDNDLPQKLRADLISIGLWIMRECEQIRLEKSSNFKGIIEVSAAIRDGLN